jgi:hypothetical protein
VHLLLCIIVLGLSLILKARAPLYQIIHQFHSRNKKILSVRGFLHHLEAPVKPHEVLLKKPVLRHWVSRRHVYPQVKDAGLPFMLFAFTRIAKETLCAGPPESLSR